MRKTAFFMAVILLVSVFNTVSVSAQGTTSAFDVRMTLQAW